MTFHMEPEYESPEDRIRRAVREAGGSGHPYASQAALEALGADTRRWSEQVRARLDDWVTRTNAALAATLEAQAKEIAELRTWRTHVDEYFSLTETRVRELEARLDQQDRDAAERRERS